MLVLVSVMSTALVGGTGAFLLLGKKCLSREEHDKICAPRTALLQKDISYMQEDVKAIKENVAFLVKRNGGRG